MHFSPFPFLNLVSLALPTPHVVQKLTVSCFLTQLKRTNLPLWCDSDNQTAQALGRWSYAVCYELNLSLSYLLLWKSSDTNVRSCHKIWNIWILHVLSPANSGSCCFLLVYAKNNCVLTLCINDKFSVFWLCLGNFLLVSSKTLCGFVWVKRLNEWEYLSPECECTALFGPQCKRSTNHADNEN